MKATQCFSILVYIILVNDLSTDNSVNKNFCSWSTQCAVHSRSAVSDSAPLWTVARQAPLSMGILQTRILEWVAMPSSRGSSQPKDQTQVSCTAGRFFTIWATILCVCVVKKKKKTHNMKSTLLTNVSGYNTVWLTPCTLLLLIMVLRFWVNHWVFKGESNFPL